LFSRLTSSPSWTVDAGPSYGTALTRHPVPSVWSDGKMHRSLKKMGGSESTTWQPKTHASSSSCSTVYTIQTLPLGQFGHASTSILRPWKEMWPAITGELSVIFFRQTDTDASPKLQWVMVAPPPSGGTPGLRAPPWPNASHAYSAIAPTWKPQLTWSAQLV